MVCQTEQRARNIESIANGTYYATRRKSVNPIAAMRATCKRADAAMIRARKLDRKVAQAGRALCTAQTQAQQAHELSAILAGVAMESIARAV
jgi:predicted secreted protein